MARGATVKVEGAAELSRKLTHLPAKLRAAAEQAVREETEEIADDMRRGAPFRTGALRESIQAEVHGLSGVAAATARHATFVEYGTSDTPQQPYATPAAARSLHRFRKRLSKRLGVALGRL